ncbi:TIGR01212 family radical SAM protein [Caproiciproducens sp. R2]|uniref:TIGR01212 family radical SAM protein n=1 Tax=Caproiciproducens sp. R2 TaxID=3435187 RepID=UPI004033D30B
MKSPFLYSNDNKRYHTLSYHLKKRFDRRVFKAVIDAGFTCPNLDGSKGFGGCTYCLSGSGDFTHGADRSVAEQVRMELNRVREKTPGADVIAYFQAHTNTYAPLPRLRELYESALGAEGVCGISIATRADALKPETVDYLAGLSGETYLTVELGLQTIHDATARRINRCHSCAAFTEAFQALKSRGIRVCVHIINGLPGETPEMMLDTARAVGALGADAVKIHLLQVMRGTPMERQLAAGEVVPMTREGYLDVVCSQLEVLPPETVIERITGDGAHDQLIAPRWGVDKISVLGGIDRALVQKDTWQGKRYV